MERFRKEELPAVGTISLDPALALGEVLDADMHRKRATSVYSEYNARVRDICRAHERLELTKAEKDAAIKRVVKEMRRGLFQPTTGQSVNFFNLFQFLIFVLLSVLKKALIHKFT